MMKKKILSKKLVLSKDTIAKLNDVEKNMIKGGTGVYPSRTGFKDVVLCYGMPCHQQ